MHRYAILLLLLLYQINEKYVNARITSSYIKQLQEIVLLVSERWSSVHHFLRENTSKNKFFISSYC